MRGDAAGVKSLPSCQPPHPNPLSTTLAFVPGAGQGIARERGLSHSAGMGSVRAPLVLSVRLKVGGDSFLGPGKIALLHRIDRLGSISAAARDMGMSYRRAWLLVDSLNRLLAEPVLATELGGAKGAERSLLPRGGGCWISTLRSKPVPPKPHRQSCARSPDF